MTRDIIVVTGTNQNSFAREVFENVSRLENQGYTCEVKFSTTEADSHFGHDRVHFSALIHAYDAE